MLAILEVCNDLKNIYSETNENSFTFILFFSLGKIIHRSKKSIIILLLLEM